MNPLSNIKSSFCNYLVLSRRQDQLPVLMILVFYILLVSQVPLPAKTTSAVVKPVSDSKQPISVTSATPIQSGKVNKPTDAKPQKKKEKKEKKPAKGARAK